MGVGGLCPKRASAQIRCKCTKKNGASDVSTSFFETRLCTLSHRALFSPHFPGITPFFFSKTRSRRALLPNLRRASPTAHSPPDIPAVPRRGKHADCEDAIARNAHNAHISRFSTFAFTPSHTHHKQLIHRSLSVKAFISDTFTRLHPLFAPSSAHAGTSHRAPMGHRPDKRRR